MRDFHPLSSKKCYACLNWDGVRTVYHTEKKIKVDDTEKGACKYWHKNFQGRDICEQFNPIRSP
jgi:hypothetical protein